MTLQITHRSNNQNRQLKRNATVKFRGKLMKASEYIKIVAEELPKMVFNDGTKVDHLQELKKFYMKDGLHGVKKYLKHVEKVNNRDYRAYKRAKFWRGLLNKIRQNFGY